MPTVKNIIQTDRIFCSTAAVKGLSLQIIDEMNLLIPGGILVPIDDLDISGDDDTVNLFLQPKAKESLRRAIRRRGQTLRLNSCYRTVVQQHVLFSWQGTSCVSIAAKPGRSNHEDGFAIDTPDFRDWMTALQDEGWDWFGPRDEVHFTYIGGGVRDDVGDIGVKAFQILWNKRNPSDEIAEDGSYGPQTSERLDRSPANGFSLGRILKLLDPLMQGEDVKKIQEMLVKLDLLDTTQVNEFYDSATEEAIKIFQTREGLSVDGQVGPATRRALKKLDRTSI